MNNNTYIHKYLKGIIDKNDIAVDMTLGNGNDAYYLCKKAKLVYGFDISKLAIERSKEKLKEFANMIIIHDNHINVDKYIKDKCRLFIFNLGYLPNSDEDTTTSVDSSLPAFIKAYNLLENGGYIIITFYFLQKGGISEFAMIDDYIKKNKIPVIDKYCQDRYRSPLTYIIRKS